ncbi:hypothetical protein LQV63_28750 [Paenibacillus profundus]|uniref:GNAT family N-acetyltransferase n=1 Tax=Paenibacillus profundus TaxID=1173085 RepID=A0ABS8YQM7_9BACL|nr:hypothetical protein [Paenibacillus profundus]MCE5173254.1 hypothetical protein [Paenibacillus profundus]
MKRLPPITRSFTPILENSLRRYNRAFSKEDYQKSFEMTFNHDQTVLLEEFMTGKEYRFLVMGDEVVGGLHLVPANDVGDGFLMIEQLVHEKNKDPLRGRGYKTPLEKIQLDEAETMFLKNHYDHCDWKSRIWS